MSSFKVEGGFELKGEIIPQGSKNEALQIISASVLVQNLEIVNCPNILDVRNLLTILVDGGAIVNWSKRDKVNILNIDTRGLNADYFASEEYFAKSEKLRGSLMLMGALLARYGKAYVPPVGGDKIGKRPIDTHLENFVLLGAKVTRDERGRGVATLTGEEFAKDVEILLSEASVTGSANLILASAIGSKDVKNLTIFNIACETYVTQLIKLLEKSGMQFQGTGSNRIVVNGNINIDFNQTVTHEVLPDFIEVASFIALAMSTRSEIIIKNAGVKYLGNTLPMFEKLGCEFEISDDDIRVIKKDVYEIKEMYDGSIATVYSSPWPMTSPDILSVGIVASLQCKGTIMFHEKMYEARMFFVDKLVAMKAKIILCDPHRVVVIGNEWKSKLKARNMTSPDIRAGIAILIAALGAEGVSVIDNIEQIERGYETIDERLTVLGARITRIN